MASLHTKKPRRKSRTERKYHRKNEWLLAVPPAFGASAKERESVGLRLVRSKIVSGNPPPRGHDDLGDRHGWVWRAMIYLRPPTNFARHVLLGDLLSDRWRMPSWPHHLSPASFRIFLWLHVRVHSLGISGH